MNLQEMMSLVGYGMLELYEVPATSLVYALSNICRRFSSNPANVRPLRTLDILISTITSFHTSNPHDTVFAVSALAEDAETVNISLDLIDYNQTPIKAFASYIAYFIDSSGTLDKFCMPWALEIEGLLSLCHDISLLKGLGSWLTPDQNREGGAPGYKAMGRSHLHDRTINTINLPSCSCALPVNLDTLICQVSDSVDFISENRKNQFLGSRIEPSGKWPLMVGQHGRFGFGLVGSLNRCKPRSFAV
jgi:hypothetical protein